MNMIEENDIIERANFFQLVQVWPLSERLDYQAWIANFKDEDKDIAYRLLNFFMYFPESMVRKMLTNSIQSAIELLSRSSDLSLKIDDIYFSYIPGETLNVSDSGAMLLRKVRDLFNIKEDKLLYVENLVQKINDNPNKKNYVIFVDDFIGTGFQATTAWNETKFKDQLLTDIFSSPNNMAIFANLISNYKGLEKVKDECSNLIVFTNHVLGPEYNLFNKECYCWEGDEELFKRAQNLIVSCCKENGGKHFHGISTQEAMGFKKQGLALAFEHGVPDATSQIFYLKSDTWNPLLKR